MRIAIIGTGLAGLAAAWSLGPTHDVVLVEPTAALGGSERSLVTPPRLGLPPLDAPDFAGSSSTHPRLLALHRLLSLPLRWDDRGLGLYDREAGHSLALSTPSSLRRLFQAITGPGLVLQAVRDALATLDAPAQPGASVAWHLLQGSASMEALHTWVWPWLGHFLGRPGANLHEVPATLAPSAVLAGSTGAPRFRTAQGHSALLDALTLDAQVRELRLGARLRSIRETCPGVQIVADEIGTQRFDAALLALPPEQLRALSPCTLPFGIMGDPKPLPRMESALVLHSDPRLLPQKARKKRGRWLSWCRERVCLTESLQTRGGAPLYISRVLGDDYLAGVITRVRRPWPPAWIPGESLLGRRPGSALLVVRPPPGPSLESALAAGLRAAHSLDPAARRLHLLHEQVAVA